MHGWDVCSCVHSHTCYTYTTLISAVVCINYGVLDSLITFSGFWIWSILQTHWVVFHTHKLYLCRYHVSTRPVFGGGVAELIYQSSAYFFLIAKRISQLLWWILFCLVGLFCFLFLWSTQCTFWGIVKTYSKSYNFSEQTPYHSLLGDAAKLNHKYLQNTGQLC